MRDKDNNIMRCIKCDSERLYFYDGWLGYESVKCRDCGHDQNDCVNPRWVKFIYRDAGGERTFLDYTVEKENAEKLRNGQQVMMGECHTPSKELFFGSHEHPAPFIPNYDNTFFEVFSVNSLGFSSEEYCAECDYVFNTPFIISTCPRCHKRVISCNACLNSAIGNRCSICRNASMFKI